MSGSSLHVRGVVDGGGGGGPHSPMYVVWLMGGGGGGPHSPMYVVWLMGGGEEGLTHPCTWCG